MEKTTYQSNYNVAIKWFGDADFVLCNKIAEIDTSVYDNLRFETYNEEDETYVEIFQWFLTNLSEDDVEFLENHFGLKFTYSDMLELFVLCVNHYGTSWDYVPIETDLENAKAELGQTIR